MEAQTYILDSEPRRKRLLSVISRIPLDGQVWDVTIKRWRPRRSLQQNSRLHALFQLVAKETGGDIESVKLGYKAMFLAGKEAIFAGRKITVYPRTSQMNSKELAEFMESVESHAISELGVFLGDN